MGQDINPNSTKQVARNVRTAVVVLNEMLERAWQDGLRVDLDVVEDLVIGSQTPRIIVNVNIYEKV